MKRIILSLLVAMTVSVGYSTGFDDSRRVELIDSISHALKNAATYTDSVNLYYDLFDLSTTSAKKDVGMALMGMAERHKDEVVMLDIARRVASSSIKRDSTLRQTLLDRISVLPDSRDREATESFIDLTAMRIKAMNSNEEERREQLNTYLRKYKTASSHLTPRENMEMLFVICTYLDSSVPGDLLTGYIDKLGEAVDKLPFHLYALYNMYYLDASIVYTNYGDAAKAVKASKRLLDIIDKLSEQSQTENRKYRNYYNHYYNTYRRLLANHAALTDDEIEEYYSKLKECVDKSLECNYDFVNAQRPQIYYLMAKKDYAKALPLIKNQVENPMNANSRRQLYDMMLIAAEAMGDKEAMLTAALESNKIQREYLAHNSQERARELQILYDMNSLQAEKTELELRNRESELDQRHSRYMVTLGLAFVMLLTVIVVLIFYYRARKLSAKLASANDMLIEERDNMQHVQRELIDARDRARKADRHKTDFINNLSHEVETPLNAIVEYSHLIVDNMSEEKRKYISKYADIVDLSADMLRSLVNDVLEIAALENSVPTVDRLPISVNTICDVAAESVKNYVHDGVKLIVDKPEENTFIINTDAKRVEQVLINLLTNGLKFTDEGTVTLSYGINTGESTVTFSVSDTGVGIPDGKEEIIFERFEKLSSTTDGLGLGLNICKMVAELLHGTVCVDRDYPGPGARFLFTIPM
ncbi:MAG: HAMP domain-containing histidine kinase [Paramuribaculum sp.]|nr:HAMP domain-containing histidine kinase [Paramuribaculum sp.]